MALVYLIIGYLLATWAFAASRPLERVGYTLLFALTAVPLVLVHVALLAPLYLAWWHAPVVSVLFLALLARHGVHYARAWKRPVFTLSDRIALAAVVPLAVFSWFYFDNTELYLSLTSYLGRGEAKCFYMQTFKLLAELNVGAGPESIRQFFGVISTPGNAVFIVGAWPLFGAQTFHVLFVAFHLLLFIFSFLLVERWTHRPWIALAAGLFAVLNPYALSIEVLDRNMMALALSAMLLFTVASRPGKHLWHGLLWGVTAGTGLRFLYLALLVPIVWSYLKHKTRPRGYVLLGVGFAGVFAFNLPHLLHHGFHSLGETASFAHLAWLAVTAPGRTPLVAYPNAVLYLLNLIDHLGYVVLALVLLGLGHAARRDWRGLIGLAAIFFAVFGILAVQRDWLENDKLRILQMGFLPLIVLFGVGLGALLDRKHWKRNAAWFVVCLTATIGAAVGLARVHGVADPQTFEKKPVYQRETPAFMDFYRAHFPSTHVLPNYARLCQKLDIPAKHDRAMLAAATLPLPVDLTPFADEVARDRWLADLPLRFADAASVTVRIDFDKLVTEPSAAVAYVESDEPPLVDFADEKNLLDVYYNEAAVSWQPQPLTVAVLPDQPARRGLGEQTIELNAFAKMGVDEYGFALVNAIHFLVGGKTAAGRVGALRALPQRAEGAVLDFRVPRGLTLVVRYWVVNGVNGTPFRVDGWRISTAEATPRIRFCYHEPESYL
jgi:hypothetical protein